MGRRGRLRSIRQVRQGAGVNIQIYALKRDFDVQKAERYFKERRIPYQFVDLGKKGMGLKELEAVRRSVGLEAMIRLSDKDWQSHYVAQLSDAQAALEKLRDDPKLLRLPIVRNGAQATVGYQPEVWAGWK